MWLLTFSSLVKSLLISLQPGLLIYAPSASLVSQGGKWGTKLALLLGTEGCRQGLPSQFAGTSQVKISARSLVSILPEGLDNLPVPALGFASHLDSVLATYDVTLAGTPEGPGGKQLTQKPSLGLSHGTKWISMLLEPGHDIKLESVAHVR